MTESKDRRGCLKGCALGCVVLIILAFGVSGIVGLLQLRGSQKAADRITEERSQNLPPVPATEQQLADATNARDLPLGPDQRPPSLAPPESGTLIIDFAMGELVVKPGDSSTIEVEADYDRARFRLVEDFKEDPDGKWTYSVTFEATSRFLGFTKTSNRVEIRVPRDHPMSIEGNLRMGEARLELGGLWLEDVDLEVGMGQTQVRFSEPTREPIGSFEIDGRMGEVGIEALGNASPTRVRASHRMGQLNIDLYGLWRNDSEISATCRMGDCSLLAANDVHYIDQGSSIALGEASVNLPDESLVPEGAPTLTLDLGARMGSVRIR